MSNEERFDAFMELSHKLAEHSMLVPTHEVLFEQGQILQRLNKLQSKLKPDPTL